MKDSKDRVDLAVSGKESHTRRHFSKDTACTPEIHRWAIMLRSQQKLRCPTPRCRELLIPSCSAAAALAAVRAAAAATGASSATFAAATAVPRQWQAKGSGQAEVGNFKE
eukprot:CAMPEP_0177450404 /NCGR_PEP_ID=MMETSP0369-20130122/9224_1 /TAXON_ID=447022 ORGANISM="Scrippsiella hangoei-like, Strain SHHI-4" /NCGR_SAMPLE_ID=MMETSP0369 /ASSEMBLY_ACC=CAM_ASM_000364 /LENGTH=109 /DNA_ID=CAMNT_0018922943 /DNA_START=457 /DNA_END=786 /DNA_ORIENTATION=+